MYIPVNTQVAQSIPFKISQTKVILQDEILNLDDLTEIENESIFKLEMQPIRPYEKDYDVQMEFTIEMNLDLLVIARSGYTFLDWMSDIGGMQGILMSGIAYLMAICNFNHFDNFMVTRLFKMEKANVDKQVFQSSW